MKKITPIFKTLKSKIIAAVAITGFAIILSSAAAGVDLFEVSKNIDIFTTIYKELNTYYVDEVDPNKLMRTGIDAMLESLDPYTNYISEAEMEGYQFQITGNYGGIGATIKPIDGKVTVLDTYEGFPANKAGLMPGDVLLTIDGKSTIGKDNEQVSDILRGSPGSSVTITYKKPFEEKEYSIAIIREEIKIGNVPYYGMASNGIGFIILTQFTEDAGRNVENALKELKKQDPNLKGVILDLRGNPGGLLREAVNISNIFIEKGKEICSTKGKVGEWDKTFLGLNQPIDLSIPLVVLTNRSSASASEIVSGVIQDYDRGVIIGQKSFGKGLVQTTRDISYKTKLKLTTAKYYIPTGRCIQALDYAHRNIDGSVGKLPDSLKTSFKTLNSNRLVYDGGGIDPDISIQPEEYHEITISLIVNNHIFNYATKFKHDHATIGNAKDFELSDSDYEAFVYYLQDKEYDYSTNTEKELAEFENQAKDELMYEAIKDEIELLKKEIGHDKQSDLFKFKSEIIFELNKEIVSRYYNQTGQIEVAFKYDPDVQKAIELLNNSEAYKSVLAPQY